jgi:ribosome-associated translation inhibitor RaiA
MDKIDFQVEFNIEVPGLPESMEIEVSERIRDLTESRKDLIGASVSVEGIAGGEEPYLFEARIVAYLRPENIAVIKKDATAEAALKQAISTLERTIRKDRSRRSGHE